ncbi:hypothetical protein [Tessaracoccus sp.]
MSDQSLRDVPLGQRVTVRRRSDDGRPTDTVGVVTGGDEESVTLETRQGPVRVMLSTVQVFRLVIPAPWRIANFLRRGEIAVIGIDALLGPDASMTATTELIDQLLTAETPVFLLTDDADKAAAALEEVDLGHLNTIVLSPGADQPGSDLLALAHARLQDQLGEVIAAGDVHFTAADPRTVEAARQLGWQARIFTPPT